jgi:1-aminocyclopropane-1-carboxylate deaminase
MPFNLPSPLEAMDIWGHTHLYIKRDDLIHPSVSGNKLRKLTGFLSKDLDGVRVVSFGGAWSNHLHALAAFCKLKNIKCIGYVRGELHTHNPTMLDVQNWGMKLIPISRSDYRQLRMENYQLIRSDLQATDLIIPEGGKGPLGMKGFHPLAEEIHRQTGNEVPRNIVAAVGTGTTVAGLASAFPDSVIWAVMAVKDPSVPPIVRRLLKIEEFQRIRWVDQFTFGGFAKKNDELIHFMQKVEQTWDLPLDYVYTAKAFWALQQLVEQKLISKSDLTIFYHSGGLQGNRSIQA